MTGYFSELLAPMGSGFIQTASDVVIKTSLALLLAWGISLGLQRASAATRHVIWVAGLVTALVIPLAVVILPAWHWAVLPALELPDPQLMPATNLPAQQIHSSNVIADAVEPLSPSSSHPVGWALLLAAVWIGGAMVMLSRFVLGWRALGSLLKKSSKSQDEAWQANLQDMKERLGVRRHVQLWTGPTGTMPMAFGLGRANVMLPAEADHWPTERSRRILLHELAHLKRWDCLTQTLGNLAVALHWFNPLAWMAAKQLRLQSELACDDLVISNGVCAQDYAEDLLGIAKSCQALRSMLAAGAVAAISSRLQDRFKAILDGQRNRRSISDTAVAGALLLTIALGACTGTMQPGRRAGKDNPLLRTATEGTYPQVQVKIAFVEVFGDNDEAISKALSQSAAPSFKSSSTVLPAGEAGTFSVGLIEESVDNLLKTLAKTHKVEVLSRPTLLCNNEQEARFTVGDLVPVASGIATLNASDKGVFILSHQLSSHQTPGALAPEAQISVGETAVHVSSDPASDSDKPVVKDNVEYRQAGLSAKLTPHIHSNGSVSLEVAFQDTRMSPMMLTLKQIPSGSKDGTFEGVLTLPAPGEKVGVQLMREAQTQVTVRNDTTFALAGLKGSDPGKGKSQLLVFFTPHIITSANDPAVKK